VTELQTQGSARVTPLTLRACSRRICGIRYFVCMLGVQICCRELQHDCTMHIHLIVKGCLLVCGGALNHLSFIVSGILLVKTIQSCSNDCYRKCAAHHVIVSTSTEFSGCLGGRRWLDLVTMSFPMNTSGVASPGMQHLLLRKPGLRGFAGKLGCRSKWTSRGSPLTH
jgi:hypothetical protein